MDTHSIAGGGLAAKIKAEGAELCSLTDDAGYQAMWPALAAWPRHAPVLFPIVGALVGDRLVHQGKEYPMGRHGFVRDCRFEWLERTQSACRLVLTDNPATRAMYPFAFRFEVAYAMVGGWVEITFSVTNTGDDVLPVSMGAHPAFNWPLRPGLAKEAHTLTFDADEIAPIRRVRDGLLLAERFANPIKHGRLALNEGLFAADAIILDQVASRSVRFTAPGAPAIEVAWEGFPHLGVWARPGVDLLCIEPWHGFSSPEGIGGEFTDKPGLMRIEAGQSRAAMHRIRIVAGRADG